MTTRNVCVSSSVQDHLDGSLISSYHLTEHLHSALNGNDNLRPPHSSVTKPYGDIHGTKHSLRSGKTRLHNIQDTFRYLVRELASYSGPVSELRFQTSSTQELNLPSTLYSRGGPKKDTRRHLLKYPTSQIQKRHWNRLSIQTRYAPLGTKLMLSRKLPSSGATLLRYGRGSVLH